MVWSWKEKDGREVYFTGEETFVSKVKTLAQLRYFQIVLNNNNNIYGGRGYELIVIIIIIIIIISIKNNFKKILLI